MKILIAPLAAMLLCGCVAVTPQPSAPLSGNAGMAAGMQVFATLCQVGTFECELTPSYTQLASLRFDAARLVRQKRVSPDVGMQVLDATDGARALLDEALAAERKGNKEHAAALLAAAKIKLGEAGLALSKGTL